MASIKHCFIDVETLGIDKNIHMIHQISGQIFIDGVSKETFDLRIQVPIDAEHSEEALTCGEEPLTMLQLSQNPLGRREAYDMFVTMLGKYVNKFNKTDKFFFVSFSGSFDKDFMYNFFLEFGDEYFFSWFWGNHVDVMTLATKRLLYQRPYMINFKLATVAETLGIKVVKDKLHDSFYDIYLTVCIFNYCSHPNEMVGDDDVRPEQQTENDRIMDKFSADADEMAHADEAMKMMNNYNTEGITAGDWAQNRTKTLKFSDVFDFGKKHSGKTINQILIDDPQYLVWYQENVTNKLFLLDSQVLDAAQKLLADKAALRKSDNFGSVTNYNASNRVSENSGYGDSNGWDDIGDDLPF